MTQHSINVMHALKIQSYSFEDLQPWTRRSLFGAAIRAFVVCTGLVKILNRREALTVILSDKSAEMTANDQQICLSLQQEKDQLLALKSMVDEYKNYTGFVCYFAKNLN